MKCGRIIPSLFVAVYRAKMRICRAKMLSVSGIVTECGVMRHVSLLVRCQSLQPEKRVMCSGRVPALRTASTFHEMWTHVSRCDSRFRFPNGLCVCAPSTFHEMWTGGCSAERDKAFDEWVLGRHKVIDGTCRFGIVSPDEVGVDGGLQVAFQVARLMFGLLANLESGNRLVR